MAKARGLAIECLLLSTTSSSVFDVAVPRMLAAAAVANATPIDLFQSFLGILRLFKTPFFQGGPRRIEPTVLNLHLAQKF